MIPANATAEKIRDGSVPLWEVTVWGGEYDYRRVYQIEATTEKQAAFDGIARFEDEVEPLVEAE